MTYFSEGKDGKKRLHREKLVCFHCGQEDALGQMVKVAGKWHYFCLSCGRKELNAQGRCAMCGKKTDVFRYIAHQYVCPRCEARMLPNPRGKKK